MKLVLYCDGTCRGNPGQGAVGGVLLNEKGQTIGEISRRIGQCTNNVAEYKALIAVLQEAKNLGADEVSVLADSELLVKQIQGKYSVKNATLRELYMQATKLASSFKKFEIKHVMREQNHRADALANMAYN